MTKSKTPEEKLAWLTKQHDYWYSRANPESGEFSAYAEGKVRYYQEKIQYWKARIEWGAESPEDREALAQRLSGGG